MRGICLFALSLALLPAAVGEAEPERPVLALDAGGHTARAMTVLFTPDGRELISVAEDKTIRVWDVASGEALRVLRTPIGSGPVGRLDAAALAPDGKALAVGGCTPNEKMLAKIYLIDLASGRVARVLTGHTNVITSLAFAPDGRRLASGSHDHTARVWDVATGQCLLALQGHTKSVYGVAWSPDVRKLLTGSFDTTGRIRSAESGRSEAVLTGHTREVRCVAWRPDGRVVATGGWDRSVKLWSPTGAAFRGFTNLHNGVMSLAFTADSRGLLYTWGGDRLGEVRRGGPRPVHRRGAGPFPGAHQHRDQRRGVARRVPGGHRRG